MNTNSQPPSAKIIQFPQKASGSRSSPGREIKSAADLRLRALPSVEFGGAWYHEAALQGEPSRKS